MTMRDHETRARALLDLTAPLITRARESEHETEDRTSFLELVEQVEALAQCFDVRVHPKIDCDAVLDEYTKTQAGLARRLRLTPVTPDDVAVRVAESDRVHKDNMGLMAQAMIVFAGPAYRIGPVRRPADSDYGLAPGAALELIPDSMRTEDKNIPEKRRMGALKAVAIEQRARVEDREVDDVLRRQADAAMESNAESIGSRAS